IVEECRPIGQASGLVAEHQWCHAVVAMGLNRAEMNAVGRVVVELQYDGLRSLRLHTRHRRVGVDMIARREEAEAGADLHNTAGLDTESRAAIEKKGAIGKAGGAIRAAMFR